MAGSNHAEVCVGLSPVDSAVSYVGNTYFNDMLGTTLGAKAKGKKYSAAALTAFGEGTGTDKEFFTGKPYFEGLGHAFLFRNYRASLAKWQTADPLGYPDGWNSLAYCWNGVTMEVDFAGAKISKLTITKSWRVEYGDGSVGFPMLDVLDFMKNKWDEGSTVMNALKIKSIEELIKAIGDDLKNEITEQLNDLLCSENWFEVVLLQLPIGYVRNEPSDNEVRLAVVEKLGANVEYEVVSMELTRITPDIEVMSGVKFLNGCVFTWEVTVRYE